MSRPSVLIVHGWEGEEYYGWVKRLAAALRADGVDVILDPGSATIVIVNDEVTLRTLEAATQGSQHVVVLCSPNYQQKASWHKEWSQMIARLPRGRLVPVLTIGAREEAMPAFLEDADPLDLSRAESFAAGYEALLRRLGISSAEAAGRSTSRGGERDPALGPPPDIRHAPKDALNGIGDMSPEDWRELALRLAAEGSKEEEAAEVQDVQVTTVTPGAVKPGARFKVEVVFHVEGFEVKAGGGRRVDADVATLPLREGARLTVRLASVDEAAFAIDDPEAPLVWGPPSRRAEFRLRAAKKLEGGVYDLRAEYWCQGVQLARSYLEIMVDRGSLADTSLPKIDHRPLPRSAFASYSRRDRADVAERVDSLLAVGIDVFLDSLDVRQGADWEEVLEEELLARDALLLFWSTAARDSEWVEKEWRFALERRGLDTILPNALEPPASCPPPPELASLQFGSVLTELAEVWRRRDGS